jgi:hypothetical protein
VVATVRVPAQQPGHRTRVQHTRTFATTTAGILALGAWLAEHGVTRVGMESIPVIRGANVKKLDIAQVVLWQTCL